MQQYIVTAKQCTKTAYLCFIPDSDIKCLTSSRILIVAGSNTCCSWYLKDSMCTCMDI